MNCTATDAQGNSTSGAFTVSVVNLPPVVTTSGNVSVEATAPAGTPVTFSAVAVDTVDHRLTATCTPASGSPFPLGTTTVTCSATDSRGQVGTATLNVTVVDTTPPTLTLPGALTADATGTGAPVAFTVGASDNGNPSPAVSCTPAAGATFPVGTTPVTCTATDASGNAATGSFDVTVRDVTPPTLQLPADITNVAATSSAGAPVTFSATATDLVDGTVSPVCTPAAGSTFPVGTTPVVCTATDAAGNSASGTFTVTVLAQTGRDHDHDHDRDGRGRHTGRDDHDRDHHADRDRDDHGRSDADQDRDGHDRGRVDHDRDDHGRRGVGPDHDEHRGNDVRQKDDRDRHAGADRDGKAPHASKKRDNHDRDGQSNGRSGRDGGGRQEGGI